MATTVGVKLKIDGEKEYKQSIKNINQETKTLDAQLKSVSKAFDEEKNGMTKTEKQSELLKQKQEALNKELDQMNDYLDKVNEAYGENSIQAMKVEEQIAKTESKLADTNSALEDLVDNSDESTSALDDLTSTIADQESQLDDLRDQYINTVLEFGEGSDEANALAGEISSLSDELNNNKDTLDNVQGSYDELIGKQENVGDSALNMAGQVAGAAGNMVLAITGGDLMGALDTVVGVFQDIVQAEIDMANNWDVSEANIVEGTGIVGQALADLEEGAKKAWAAVGYEGFDESAAGNVAANLNTFFGISDTNEIAEMETALANYANLTGEDAAATVESLNSVMNAWGLYTGDTSEDINTMKTLLEQFYAASTQSGVGANEMMDALADNNGNFQDFNWSLEDATDKITQFCKTGGTVSEFTGAIDKLYKKMHDKTDDLSKVWDKVYEAIEKTDNEQDYLNTKIEDTTVNDIFTYNKAKALYNRLHKAYVSPLEEVTSAREQVMSDYDAIIDKAETYTERLEKAKRATEELTGSAGLAGIASTITNFVAPTESAMNVWKNIANFLGVNTSTWSFANGYDQAYVLSNPTIFGQSASGTPLIGGDRAGNEVVVGESHLLSMIQSAVSSDGKLDTMINLLAQYLPHMNNQTIYLDGDVLVGQTASKMDRALGRL